MLGLALAFVLGNLSCLLCPAVSPAGWAGGASMLALLLLPWHRSRFLACLLAGWGLTAHALAEHRAGLQAEEERVIGELRIVGLPQVTATGVHVDALLQVPRQPERPAQVLRLNWPGAEGRGLRAGERWQLLLRLRPPQGACNPGAVDTARNALRDHVQAFATVIASPLDRRLDAAAPGLLQRREDIAARIQARVADPASAALLAALAVGATGDVSREQWRLFNVTGITHLVAISGSHVTAFAMIAMGLVRRAWRFAALRGLTWRREPIVAVVGVLLSLGYALLAGAGVPTQRTLLMLAAFLLLRGCGRIVQAGTPLGLAAVAVILLDPFCTLSAGFWLSFLAVAAILGLAGGRLLPESGIRAAVSVQGAVFVALLPATLAIFGSVSLVGVLVNVLAIPLFGLVLVPLTLAATAAWLLLPDLLSDPLAGLLVDLAAAAAGLAMRGLMAASGLSWSQWFAAPPLFWYGLVLLAIVCVLPPWSLRLRLAGACVLLPVLGMADVPATGVLRMTLFDVGAGAAALLETSQHRWLFGVGEGPHGAGGQAERVILPALALHGAKRLDAVVLPSLTRDAGGGVTALLARVPVAALHAPASRGLPPDFLACNGVIGRDGAWQLQARELPGAGCVMEATAPGAAVLLADHLGAEAAAALRAMAPAAPDASPLVLVRRRRAADPPLGSMPLSWADTARDGAITVTLADSGQRSTAACRDTRIGAWSATAAPGKSAVP